METDEPTCSASYNICRDIDAVRCPFHSPPRAEDVLRLRAHIVKLEKALHRAIESGGIGTVLFGVSVHVPARGQAEAVNAPQDHCMIRRLIVSAASEPLAISNIRVGSRCLDYACGEMTAAAFSSNVAPENTIRLNTAISVGQNFTVRLHNNTDKDIYFEATVHGKTLAPDPRYFPRYNPGS